MNVNSETNDQSYLWGGKSIFEKTKQQRNNFELSVKEKTLKGSKYKGATHNIQIN